MKNVRKTQRCRNRMRSKRPSASKKLDHVLGHTSIIGSERSAFRGALYRQRWRNNQRSSSKASSAAIQSVTIQSVSIQCNHSANIPVTIQKHPKLADFVVLIRNIACDQKLSILGATAYFSRATDWLISTDYAGVMIVRKWSLHTTKSQSGWYKVESIKFIQSFAPRSARIIDRAFSSNRKPKEQSTEHTL